MSAPSRLNERAAPRREASVWHVDEGWSVFAGPLERNAPHAHSTAVYLAGLYGPFRLRIGRSAWGWCRSAAIRAGTPYEFDIAGDVLGVIYLEPSIAGAEALAALVQDGEATGGAVVGRGEASPMRELYEARDNAPRTREALADVLAFARRRAVRQIDQRIERAVGALATADGHAVAVCQAAAMANLSPSRFQHLFSREVGVPFRRYRLWQRLRRAIREASRGATLTEAAHTAGFADQAHFSRAFRAAFGAPPSRGL